MPEEEGGGASRSTEPAAGSSSGTDIELLYLIEALRTGDSRFHSLFSKLIDREIRHVRDLYEQAFRERDKALERETHELLRRLDVLNHAHEQAREKERDFIGREAFDTFVVHTADDFKNIRSEIQLVAKAASEAREGAARALADALAEQNKTNSERFSRIEGSLIGRETFAKQNETNDSRFSRLENAQSKMIGGLVLCTFLVPLLTATVVFLITRGG